MLGASQAHAFFTLPELNNLKAHTLPRTTQPAHNATQEKGRPESLPHLLSRPAIQRLCRCRLSELRRDPRGDLNSCLSDFGTRADSGVQMRSQPERVAECTSINFDGMIAMVNPEESWVAKWQRISACWAEGGVPGQQS